MNTTANTHTVQKVRELLTTVHDPEIPVLNIVEMGIVRSVELNSDAVEIRIVPTYSGCPAMWAIEENIRRRLTDSGIRDFTIIKDRTSAWTTEWMSARAKQKLKEYGIAPPEHLEHKSVPLENQKISCPYCDSVNTRLQSEFGSTPCKAQFYCIECTESFEYFKCH